MVWAENPKPNPRLDNRLKDVEEKLELPPLQATNCAISSTGSRTIRSPRAAWCCACACAWASTSAQSASASACALPAPPPQRMTAARGRVLALLADGMVRGKSEAAREAGVSAGVIDGLIDEGTLETVVLPPEPVAEKPDPDFAQPDFTRRPKRRRRGAESDHRRRRIFGHAARRRHRLGQDRSLFRGRGRHHPPRPAKPDPDAGDRAHRAVPRPFRRAFRHASGGMAFGARRRADARAPGGRSPTAKSPSWSARARRCSCPTPISA